MNEKWTTLIHILSILGTIIISLVILFDKSRKWVLELPRKIFTKKEKSYLAIRIERAKLQNTIKKAQMRISEIDGERKPHRPMSDNVKSIIIACIISFGLIVSAIIYAYSNRYQIEKFVRIDKWKGTYQKLELQAK